MGCKFREIDRDDRAQWNRHGKADKSRCHRARDQRHDPVAGVGEQRCPHRVGQEFLDGHVLEEKTRFVYEDENDRDRRKHRHETRGQQHQFDDSVPHLAIAQRCGKPGCQRSGGLVHGLRPNPFVVKVASTPVCDLTFRRAQTLIHHRASALVWKNREAPLGTSQVSRSAERCDKLRGPPPWTAVLPP